MKFITNTSDLAKFLNKKIKFNALIKSISTDTRSLKKNSLFIAIKGDNFDGNDFANKAIEIGTIEFTILNFLAKSFSEL